MHPSLTFDNTLVLASVTTSHTAIIKPIDSPSITSLASNFVLLLLDQNDLPLEILFSLNVVLLLLFPLSQSLLILFFSFLNTNLFFFDIAANAFALGTFIWLLFCQLLAIMTKPRTQSSYHFLLVMGGMTILAVDLTPAFYMILAATLTKYLQFPNNWAMAAYILGHWFIKFLLSGCSQYWLIER